MRRSMKERDQYRDERKRAELDEEADLMRRCREVNEIIKRMGAQHENL